MNSALATEGRFLLKAGIFPQLFNRAVKGRLLCIRARLQSCRKGSKTKLGFSPCGRLGTRDLSTLSRVGAPCFSRGKLDFSPAGKRLILKGGL
jgi:hypothetical protein